MTEEKNHTDRTHSKLGGSTANRWTNCTGSVFLLDTLPPEPPGEAAIEGTKAHELAEKFLEMYLQGQIDGGSYSIDLLNCSEEMIDGAKYYYETVWKELLDESITGKAYGLEEKFAIDSNLDMGGIVDFWAVYLDDKAKRVGVVADYKFGFTPVLAKNNAQLAFYAVALRKEMKAAGKDLDLVYAAIIQPRLTDEKKRFQKVKFTAKQLDTWEKKFYKAADEIFVQKKPKFKVGDWCKFCGAKAVCKEYNKHMVSKTSLKLIDVEEVKLPAPETLSKEQIAKVVLHYDLLKDYLDACYSHALNSMKAGKKFPGLKLVEGKTRRKWREDDPDSENKIINAILQHGIEPTKSELKNLTTIEKELAAKYDKTKAKEIMSELTQNSIASVSVVSDTDPRQEVKNLLDNL